MNADEAFNRLHRAVNQAKDYWQEQGLTHDEVADQMRRMDVEVSEEINNLLISIMQDNE